MQIPKQLIDCLDQNDVHYEILHHTEAVTAQRIAQAEHVKGRHQAKVVMLKSGDQHVMMVLPADHHIDLEKVERVLGKSVSIDKEEEFKSLFRTPPSARCRRLEIFTGWRPTSTNVLPDRTTLCLKPARTLTR